MIPGVDFSLCEFQKAWPKFEARAARWVDADAVEQAKAIDKSGNGACMVGNDGLVVLTLETGDNGEDRLFVLLGVSSGRPGAIQRQEQAIIAIARNLGVSRIAFRTRRGGFERALGREWTREGDEFSRSV